jgi:hypothetical protein
VVGHGFKVEDKKKKKKKKKKIEHLKNDNLIAPQNLPNASLNNDLNF